MHTIGPKPGASHQLLQPPTFSVCRSTADVFISVNTQSGKLVTGLPAMSANALYIVDHPSATVQRSAAKLHRKQIPLCRFHHLEIEKGKYYPMDPDFLKEVLRTNAPAHLQDLKVLHIIENAEKETQGGPKGRFFSTARSLVVSPKRSEGAKHSFAALETTKTWLTLNNWAGRLRRTPAGPHHAAQGGRQYKGR